MSGCPPQSNRRGARTLTTKPLSYTAGEGGERSETDEGGMRRSGSV